MNEFREKVLDDCASRTDPYAGRDRAEGDAVGLLYNLLFRAPKVWKEGQSLWARTPLLLQILLLGFYGKTVCFSAYAKTVTVWTRIFWFWTLKKEIPFDRVHYIKYDFEDTTLGGNWESSTYESFRIGLKLNAPREDQHLFTYCGATHTDRGWLWSRTTGQTADDDASRRFVDEIRELIGCNINTP